MTGLLTRLQSANDGVAAAADRELRAFLSGLDLTDVAAVKAAVFEYVPVLVEKYGDMAALVAADWFDEFRAAEAIGGRYKAVLAPATGSDVVARRLGFATREGGALALGLPTDFVAFLSLMVNEYVMAPGHDTVLENTFKSGAAYARVPEPGACDFCLMLASRGFVYSKATVGDSTKFHGNCRCHGMPVWDETKARVKYGYDPDRLYEQYLSAREAAGGDTKDIVAEMRRRRTT